MTKPINQSINQSTSAASLRTDHYHILDFADLLAVMTGWSLSYLVYSSADPQLSDLNERRRDIG